MHYGWSYATPGVSGGLQNGDFEVANALWGPILDQKMVISESSRKGIKTFEGSFGVIFDRKSALPAP